MLELEVDLVFNEFEVDVVICVYLLDLFEEQLEVLYIFCYVVEYWVEFQCLFFIIIVCWVFGNYEKDGLESWQEFFDKVYDGFCCLLVQVSGKDRVVVFIFGGIIIVLF